MTATEDNNIPPHAQTLKVSTTPSLTCEVELQQQHMDNMMGETGLEMLRTLSPIPTVVHLIFCKITSRMLAWGTMLLEKQPVKALFLFCARLQNPTLSIQTHNLKHEAES